MSCPYLTPLPLSFDDKYGDLPIPLSDEPSPPMFEKRRFDANNPIDIANRQIAEAVNAVKLAQEI